MLCSSALLSDHLPLPASNPFLLKVGMSLAVLIRFAYRRWQRRPKDMAYIEKVVRERVPI